MTSLPLVILPDPRLSQKCEDVNAAKDPLSQWVADMTDTMRVNQGIGLAACQVGLMKRLAIVDVGLIQGRDRHEDEHYEPVSEIAVFINPEVVWASEERSIFEEGCLSIPDFHAEVERPSRIRVTYEDQKGKPCDLEADGLLAVCLQHEIDHLNGILFISYLSPLKRNRVLERFRKEENRKRKAERLDSAK
jgi:peptide deformylase